MKTIKIASIQLKTEVENRKDTVKPRQDEFFHVLSQEITKESESPSNSENINQELKDENKEDEKDLVLVWMQNIPFIKKSELNIIPEEFISPVSDIDTPIIEYINNTIANEEQKSLECLVNKITYKGDTSQAVNLTSDINNMDNLIINRESPNIGDVKILHGEEVNLQLDEQDSSLMGEIVPKLVEKNAISKIPKDQNLVKDNFATKIKDTTKLDLKENMTTKDNHNLNIVDSSQLKNFSTISLNSNIDYKEPVLFNDNLHKINDSIIQLMETTTEGNTQVLKVKLFPENLGTVNVTLKMEEGKLIAKILVDNDYIKGLFANKVNELNEGLVKQNIYLEKINIDLNLKSDSNNNFNFDLDQNRNFSQRRENYSRRGRYGIFNDEFVNTAIPEEYILNSREISILA